MYMITKMNSYLGFLHRGFFLGGGGQKHRFGVVSDMLLVLYNYAYMHNKNLISTVSLKKKKSCNVISF